MNTEITSELLADLKAKAEAATPGPWCTCLTAEKVLGRKHPDWGCIYANVQSSKTGEILEGCQLAAVNQWLASEEEKDAAREKYFKEGIETNPGLMGANAEYIAAANPQMMLSLADFIERLEAEIANLEREKIAYYKAFDKLAEKLGVFQETDPGKPETFEVFAKVFERQEKEARWLAENLVRNHNDSFLGAMTEDRTGYIVYNTKDAAVKSWLKAARKAVEAE